MNMTDHNEMKARLETMLQSVRSELKELGIEQPVDGDWVTTPEDVATAEADPNVAADRSEEWAERRGVLAELETRFNNIKLALRKIADGTYGVCEVSGEPIEADRLEANPAARTCKAHMDEVV